MAYVHCIIMLEEGVRRKGMREDRRKEGRKRRIREMVFCKLEGRFGDLEESCEP